MLDKVVRHEQLVRDQGSLACGPPNVFKFEDSVDEDGIQGVATDLAVALAGQQCLRKRQLGGEVLDP